MQFWQLYAAPFFGGHVQSTWPGRDCNSPPGHYITESECLYAMPFNFTCETCGRVFASDHSRVRRYCSLNCSHIGRTIAPEQRIWDKVDKNGDCWLWTGALINGGYGSFHVESAGRARSVAWLAHRYVYLLLVGPIPPGFHVDHVCHNRDLSCPGGDYTCMHRRCVNPEHLEAVSARTNVLRGRGLAAQEAAMTHCHAGHPYTGSNVFITGGRRRCRECRDLSHVARRRQYVQLPLLADDEHARSRK